MCSFSTRINEGIPRSFFNDHFVLINRLSGNFSAWEYVPGMQFEDKWKWWGNRGERVGPHEGVDLYSFRDNSGISKEVTPDLQFPPLFAGSVVGIFPDFLGKSILFRHDCWANNSWQLYSVFGHTRPLNEINSGVMVSAGQPVAALVEPKKQAKVPAHLHISLMWISPGNEVEALDWRSIASSVEIILVDPLKVFFHYES